MNNEQYGYADIMEFIKDDIMGVGDYKIPDDGKMRSTTVLSRIYEVNPTTAVKAVSKLQDEKILRKEPGIGMYVVEGAKEIIIEQRKKIFEERKIGDFLNEGKKLGFSLDDIIKMIRNQHESIR